MRFDRRSLLMPVVFALAMFVGRPAHAAPITLEFTGTFTTLGVVFGLAPPTVPFDFTITYDPALDTNTEFAAAGSAFGSGVAGNDWFGYSKSGVIASNITLGSHTFTAADMRSIIPAVGHAADLWFDTDISLATPTKSWIFFQNAALGSPVLRLGNGVGGPLVFLITSVEVDDAQTGGEGTGQERISSVISAVPEPATLVLVGTGVALTRAATRLTRRRRGNSSRR